MDSDISQKRNCNAKSAAVRLRKVRIHREAASRLEVIFLDLIIAQNDREIAKLRASRAMFTDRGMRSFSRWGSQPFAETTASDLIDGNIAELEQLTADIVSGRFN
ncbi:hypothetical protein V1281_004313 [Nitrobacteraceae bacterium AZCC 2161]